MIVNVQITSSVYVCILLHQGLLGPLCKLVYAIKLHSLIVSVHFPENKYRCLFKPLQEHHLKFEPKNSIQLTTLQSFMSAVPQANRALILWYWSCMPCVNNHMLEVTQNCSGMYWIAKKTTKTKWMWYKYMAVNRGLKTFLSQNLKVFTIAITEEIKNSFLVTCDNRNGDGEPVTAPVWLQPAARKSSWVWTNFIRKTWNSWLKFQLLNHSEWKRWQW